MEYRARFEDGTLRLLANNLPDLAQGELVTVIIERGRSLNSHRHQFAFVREAWQNLPEHLQSAPWAETPETMRKHALIATGFHQSYTLDCGANATAQRIKAQLVRAEARAEGYAIGQVRGPILTIWTAESQSMRSMGGKRFQESKQKILEWLSAQLGVSATDLKGAGHDMQH